MGLSRIDTPASPQRAQQPEPHQPQRVRFRYREHGGMRIAQDADIVEGHGFVGRDEVVRGQTERELRGTVGYRITVVGEGGREFTETVGEISAARPADEVIEQREMTAAVEAVLERDGVVALEAIAAGRGQGDNQGQILIGTYILRGEGDAVRRRRRAAIEIARAEISTTGDAGEAVTKREPALWQRREEAGGRGIEAAVGHRVCVRAFEAFLEYDLAVGGVHGASFVLVCVFVSLLVFGFFL